MCFGMLSYDIHVFLPDILFLCKLFQKHLFCVCHTVCEKVTEDNCADIHPYMVYCSSERHIVCVVRVEKYL